MRFIVVGAGAVGGVVGGRLAQHGHDVVLVARRAHRAAIAADGLRIRSPDDEVQVRVPAVEHPRELALGSDDVVLLAVKGQDTGAALAALGGGPPDLAVACLQNGVDNERQVLRRTPNAYAVPVMLPATYLEPGVVDASSAPVTGILDVGRYPSGVDDRAEAISAAFASSTFSSVTNAAVMRFKWSKLLMNLGNAIEAAVGPIGRGSDLYARARDEAEAWQRSLATLGGLDRSLEANGAAVRVQMREETPRFRLVGNAGLHLAMPPASA